MLSDGIRLYIHLEMYIVLFRFFAGANVILQKRTRDFFFFSPYKNNSKRSNRICIIGDVVIMQRGKYFK